MAVERSFNRSERRRGIAVKGGPASVTSDVSGGITRLVIG